MVRYFCRNADLTTAVGLQIDREIIMTPAAPQEFKNATRQVLIVSDPDVFHRSRGQRGFFRLEVRRCSAVCTCYFSFCFHFHNLH